MPLAVPPELKPITAYIRRAEELDADKSDPAHQKIAYYCRSHAMGKAMNLGASGDSVNTFLMTLMQDLENAKAAMSLPKEEAKALCEGYAVGIFHKADDEDRGDSNNYREIARTFYNSSTFFDVLEQFGELDEEINSKRTYSKWKATEIMKALKEGRTPTPGGYGGDEAPRSDISDTTNTSGMQDLSLAPTPPVDLPPAPTGLDRSLPSTLPSPPGSFQMPTQPQYGQQQQFQPPPQQQQFQPPPQQQQFQPPPQQHFQPPHSPQHHYPPQQHQPPHHVPSTASAPLQPASHQPSPNYVPPPKTTNQQGNIADALELCSFAMAALKHNDTKLGADRLRDALRLLS
jgi:vacuolar protein sorting-associated protein VTA1